MRKLPFILGLALALSTAACGDGDGGGGGGGGSGNPDGGGGSGAVDGAPNDAGPDFDLTVQSIAGGDFYGLAPDAAIRGQGLIVRMAEATQARLHAEGLEPSTEYTAHVHALPCEVGQGGGHYKLDPSVAETVEENEIWLTFTTNAEGVADAEARVDGHRARMDAQSIVIHAPGGDKLACSNLRLGPEESATLEGTFAAVPGGTETAIGGTVSMTVNYTATGDQTTLTFNPTGLDPAGSYIAHVHALPCEVNVGGGHYEFDPAGEDNNPENEIWFDPIEVGQNGSATIELTVDHLARGDAQSVVIHRQQPDNMAPKVACANLARNEYPEYVVASQGEVVIYEAGEAIGFNPGVSATLTRNKAGQTVAVLTVNEGLDEGAVYPVHIHAYTCETNSGGGHYKLDPTVADTVETNEIWLNLTGGADGNAEVTKEVEQIVRPDASSIVIHGPDGDNPKLACINLGFGAL